MVISDVENAGILERARDARIAGGVISRRASFARSWMKRRRRLLSWRCRRRGWIWWCWRGLCEFCRGILRTFANRAVNIHPALLPAFPGLEAWKQALDYGVKVTGVTVHFVDQGIDTGLDYRPANRAGPAGDTAETFHARIQDAERKIYPATIAALARGEIRVYGRQSCWTGP